MKPVQGTDFFYRKNRSLRPRKKYFLGRGSSSNCRCLVCEAPSSRRRLWLHDALMAHLSTSHRISCTVEGIHWKRLQLICKTTDDLESTRPG
ncbi:hypothetical protein GALMADRAFT_1137359 [Galerina marginata CBS 339.88]|uniref:Uncharacterized protein n=1 Tax=Galerina marginata (strain CBS 339.88) TaxID=685588 RepID=A0A067S818_GALM3|nr:hypothetical protein GALMADRAFT_1137359 [Galerina marginata CBS 339.88]